MKQPKSFLLGGGQNATQLYANDSKHNMKRYFQFSKLLIIIFLSSIQLFPQSISDIVERVDKSVVMIIIYDATGSAVGQGSGVFVTVDGKILTNAHVLEDAYSAEVKSTIGNFERVQILYIDKNRDLAFIQVQTSNSIPPGLATDTDFKSGQRVIAIGNPLGLEKTVSDGLISGIRRTEDGIELIQTTVPISPGSSGGVLLDEYGFLIGITTSTFYGGQNINFAISLNTILKFAEDYKKADTQGIKVEQLKPAKESVWYSVVLHWIGNIFAFLLSLIFGTAFYYVIPLVMVAGYIIYGIAIGLWWLISYPFRKAREKKERTARLNYISQTNYDDSSNYSSSPNDYDNIFEEGYNNKELEEGLLEFYCPKCGHKNQVQNSIRGEMTSCISCKKSITVPLD